MELRVKVWGCRGSIATPSPLHVKYGGNTTCVEVDAGNQKFILDCGTGIRNLGQHLMENPVDHFDILLTHTHWDHINGFPFFAPAFVSSNKFNIHAGHLKDNGGIQKVFETQMENPLFPVPLQAMQARIDFHDFYSGESLEIAKSKSIRVITAGLNHPSGATGYRIECGGKSFCLITDTEHIEGKLDENILGLIEGADLVLYDSTYTQEEFKTRIGWGHSTWNEGVKLCRTAGVKRLGIFHHDPDHDDVFMDNLAREAAQEWDGAFVIEENMDFLVQ